jgi:hypothetical protein
VTWPNPTQSETIKSVVIGDFQEPKGAAIISAMVFFLPRLTKLPEPDHFARFAICEHPSLASVLTPSSRAMIENAGKAAPAIIQDNYR